MKTKIEKVGFLLVLLMVILQGFYGLFSYFDPTAFSVVRGTQLFAEMDADWIRIYGSRTIFITVFFAYLLYTKNYPVLMWGAVLGAIMPVTDGILAYQSQAPLNVVLKHVATVIYLLLTFFVLKKVVAQHQTKSQTTLKE